MGKSSFDFLRYGNFEQDEQGRIRLFSDAQRKSWQEQEEERKKRKEWEETRKQKEQSIQESEEAKKKQRNPATNVLSFLQNTLEYSLSGEYLKPLEKVSQEWGSEKRDSFRQGGVRQVLSELPRDVGEAMQDPYARRLQDAYITGKQAEANTEIANQNSQLVDIANSLKDSDSERRERILRIASSDAKPELLQQELQKASEGDLGTNISLGEGLQMTGESALFGAQFIPMGQVSRLNSVASLGLGDDLLRTAPQWVRSIKTGIKYAIGVDEVGEIVETGATKGLQEIFKTSFIRGSLSGSTQGMVDSFPEVFDQDIATQDKAKLVAQNVALNAVVGVMFDLGLSGLSNVVGGVINDQMAKRYIEKFKENNPSSLDVGNLAFDSRNIDSILEARQTVNEFAKSEGKEVLGETIGLSKEAPELYRYAKESFLDPLIEKSQNGEMVTLVEMRGAVEKMKQFLEADEIKTMSVRVVDPETLAVLDNTKNKLVNGEEITPQDLRIHEGVPIEGNRDGVDIGFAEVDGKRVRYVTGDGVEMKGTVRSDTLELDNGRKVELTPDFKQRILENFDIEGVNTEAKFQVEDVTNLKEMQLEVVNRLNPMTDDYHTGIRTIEDIKTYQETFEDPESFVYPDFSKQDAQNALDTGSITVYSSKPLDENKAQFVSPSKMQAEDYAGGQKVYSKEVKLDEVAWINGDEGQLVGGRGQKFQTAEPLLSVEERDTLKKFKESLILGDEITEDVEGVINEVFQQNGMKIDNANENVMTRSVDELLDKDDVIRFDNKAESDLRDYAGNATRLKEYENTVRKYFSEDEVGVNFTANIRTPQGQKALGVYYDKMITFAKGANETTPEHEVLHAYFDLFTAPERKTEVLAQVKKQQGLEGDLEAEEWLADSFVDFVRDNKKAETLPEKIREMFTEVWEKVKKLVGKEDKVKNLYKDIVDLDRNYVKKADSGKDPSEFLQFEKPMFQVQSDEVDVMVKQMLGVPEGKTKSVYDNPRLKEVETQGMQKNKEAKASEKKLAEIEQSLEATQSELENHPGKALMKYMSKKEGQLPEIGDTSTIWGRKSDDISRALGFADENEAIQAFESYRKLKESVQDLKDFKEIENLKYERLTREFNDLKAERDTIFETRDTGEVVPEKTKFAKLQEEVKSKPQEEFAGGKGETAISKDIQEKVKKDLGMDLEIQGYDTKTNRSQVRQVSELMEKDPERLKRIALGDEEAPEGMLRSSAFVAIEEMATKNKDFDTLQKLANSQMATELGQEMQFLSNRKPYSPVKKIEEVMRSKEARVKKTTGKTAKRTIREDVEQAQKIEVKVDKSMISSVLDSITC